MSDAQSDHLRLALTVLAAFWLMAFVYSFVSYGVALPDGDGFTRGMNRVQSFLGWQAIAGLLAVALFAVGRRWPAGSSIRRMAGVPIAATVVLIVLICGILVWASASG